METILVPIQNSDSENQICRSLNLKCLTEMKGETDEQGITIGLC